MKWTKWIVAALLVLAVAAGGFGIARWLGPKEPATRISVNVQSIRKIAQLATVEYRLSTLVERTFRSNWGAGTCDSSKMLAYYTGTVKGSIDLEKVELEVKDLAPASADGPTRRKATIRFPQGAIVVKDVALVPGQDSMREMVTWVKTGFKGPSDGQRERVRQDALKTILDTAIQQGIIEKTKENAKLILSEFLGGLGMEAEIVFDEKAYDPSLASN